MRDAHAQRRRQLLSERRPDLPVAFIRVVERAIAADPEERYANAGELLQALGTVTFARPPLKPTLRYALVAGLIVFGMTALGGMTSAAFNLTLQRSDFVNETFLDWLVWGRRTSVPPFLILMMVALAGTVLTVLRRLLVATSAYGRRLDAAARRGTADLARRFRLDEVSVLSAYALLLSASVLAAAWWYFTPLIVALLTYVSTGPAENLRILSPDFVTYHNYYRGTFSFVAIFSVAVWYPVAKLVRKGQSINWGMVAGGAIVTCIALALLHFPYRVLYFNRVFDAASWNGAHCYIIGERSDDLLVFCPEAEPPRTRTITKGDGALQRLGVRESIFTRFGGSGPDPVTGKDP